MDVTARMWTGYQWRVFLITAMCLGFAGWCLYDATVGYPSKNQIATAWEDFPGEYLAKWWEPVASENAWPKDPREMIEVFRDLNEYEKATEWPKKAAANDWPEDPTALIEAYKNGGSSYRDDHWRELAQQKGWPEDRADVPHPKTALDIITQFIMLGIAAPPGLFFLYAFIRSIRCWIQCTDAQLVTSRGQRVPIDTITRLNKQRWHKGIAVVHFKSGNKQQRLVLDDWKYEQAAIGKMVEFLEQQLPADRIDQPKDTAMASTEGDSEG